jgi:pimeloyl-ACP methyl ester carboxylesterase/DNA-binding SARP family transcriptional activator
MSAMPASACAPRIELLGPPRFVRGDQPLDLGLRKGVALLACLAASATPPSRDHLAELLWPETAPGVGRARLRRTLHKIALALGSPTVVAEGEFLRLDGAIGSDLHDHRERLAEASRTVDATARCELLKQADSLYRGTFLQGFELPEAQAFEDWRQATAREMQEARADTLASLVDLLREAGRLDEAIAFARRLLALDRLEESSHRRLITLLLEAARPGAARAQLAECERLLRQELDVAPTAQTLTLLGNDRPMARRAPETRYTASEGAHMAYQFVGDGPVDLLMIPGFVSHLELFWEEPALAHFLDRLSGSARLILFDRRGSGLSDRTGGPPTTTSTGIDIGAVLDAVGVQRAVLFGHSEGGPSAIEFAVRHPRRVAGLILFGSMARGQRAPDYPWALESTAFQRWLERLVSQWGGPANLDVFAPSMADDPQLRDWWARTLRLGSSPGAVRATLDALRRSDVRDLLPFVTAPTLVLHRSGDRAVPFAAGKYLSEHITDAHWILLDGDDHWPWIGNADLVLEHVARFLRSLPAVR